MKESTLIDVECWELTGGRDGNIFLPQLFSICRRFPRRTARLLGVLVSSPHFIGLIQELLTQMVLLTL